MNNLIFQGYKEHRAQYQNANIVCEISQENLEFGANHSDVVMVKEKKRRNAEGLRQDYPVT